MVQQASKPNLFTFNNYRDFLLAYARYMKDEKTLWSLGMWARRLELKTTSSLTKILNGERNPGRDISDKLVRYFEFSEQEAEYFRDLVRLEKFKDDNRLVTLLQERMKRDYQCAISVGS